MHMSYQLIKNIKQELEDKLTCFSLLVSVNISNVKIKKLPMKEKSPFFIKLIFATTP